MHALLMPEHMYVSAPKNLSPFNLPPRVTMSKYPPHAYTIILYHYIINCDTCTRARTRTHTPRQARTRDHKKNACTLRHAREHLCTHSFLPRATTSHTHHMSHHTTKDTTKHVGELHASHLSFFCTKNEPHSSPRTNYMPFQKLLRNVKKINDFLDFEI